MGMGEKSKIPTLSHTEREKGGAPWGVEIIERVGQAPPSSINLNATVEERPFRVA